MRLYGYWRCEHGFSVVSRLFAHLTHSGLSGRLSFFYATNDACEPFVFRPAEHEYLAFVVTHERAHRISPIGIRTFVLRLKDRADNLLDEQFEFDGKLIVALIVCGYCHDGSRAVLRKHIVGDIERNLLTGRRVDGLNTLELHARFFFCCLPVHVGHLLRSLNVLFNFISILQSVTPRLPSEALAKEGVLRSEHEIRSTEKRVGPRCEHTNRWGTCRKRFRLNGTVEMTCVRGNF